MIGPLASTPIAAVAADRLQRTSHSLRFEWESCDALYAITRILGKICRARTAVEPTDCRIEHVPGCGFRCFEARLSNSNPLGANACSICRSSIGSAACFRLCAWVL